MKRPALRTASAAAALSLALAAGLLLSSLVEGCLANESSALGSRETPKAVGEGGSEGCSIFADGFCDLVAGETCACGDCVATAYCIAQRGGPVTCGGPGQSDGRCDPITDFCVCPDCSRDPSCQDPARKNCNDTTICEGYLEGCLCPDCLDGGAPSCLDSDTAKACVGEAADGVCAEGEGCGCLDCLWMSACAPCQADGVCAVEEGCACDDCRSDPHCTACGEADGFCDILDEGCGCDDCSGDPACAGDAGGAGGAGG